MAMVVRQVAGMHLSYLLERVSGSLVFCTDSWAVTMGGSLLAHLPSIARGTFTERPKFSERSAAAQFTSSQPKEAAAGSSQLSMLLTTVLMEVCPRDRSS